MLQHYKSVILATPGLIPLLAVSTIMMAGNGIAAPVLSIYATTFSASGTIVGLVVTLFGLGRLLANLPAGLLSQRFGLRPVLLAGPLVLAVGSVGAALAHDLISLLVWRFVQGVGSGIFMTASMVTLARAVGRGRATGTVTSLHQAAFVAGSALGPAVGGVLAHAFGITAPFWGYAAAAILAVCMIAATPVGVAAVAIDPDRPRVSMREAGIGSMTFLSLCLANFGLFFSRSAAMLTLIPLLGYSAFGLELHIIGAALAAAAVCNFLAAPLGGLMIDRFGALTSTSVSIVAAIIGLVVIGTASAPIWFWAGLLIYGAGQGLVGAGIVTLAMYRVEEESYAPALAYLRTLGDCGFVVGPILVGWLGDAFGFDPGDLVLITALLLALGLGGLVLFRKRSRLPSPTSP